VFCPCKGIDHDFEKNVRSVLLQDYADFIVYFIVESKNDPAFAVLQSIGARNVLVAGQALECGQKVHNLRFAVERADATAQIYVFCDSDARYPRNWLSRLTAPLAGRDAGVSTGYRWYVASQFDGPTLLRSAWNSTALSLLGDHNHNFAWGGSLAIRRATFESIGVLNAWRGAVSDDYAITRAAESAGVTVHFTPACLIPSYGECSFRELLEFTTRQIIITRVYRPQLWRVGLIAQTVFNLTFLALPAAALAGGGAAFVLLWLIIYTLSAARSALRLFAVREVLHDPSLWRFAWFYILSPPVVSLIYEYNMLLSAVTTHIEWRNIHYKLISPNETRVRRSSAGAS
jgi:cellulose synthase/poly-beta-1,6-N-acetylglucosamine synthase-like glycosyltransferase